MVFVIQRRAQQRLRDIAARDPLTGLLNRREGTRRLQMLAAGSQAWTLLLLDIDHFKNINDHHGHGSGDQALKALVACLHRSCTASASIARWGGEEFLVVCPATSAEDAMRLADRLCTDVAALQIAVTDGREVRMTVSVGLAPLPFFPSTTERNWQASLRLADAALYAAKRGGRNTWAGLWGLPPATFLDLPSIEADPQAAARAGKIQMLARTPEIWDNTPTPSENGSVASRAYAPS